MYAMLFVYYIFIILFLYTANIFFCFSCPSVYFASPHNVQLRVPIEKMERKQFSMMRQRTI